MPSVRPVTAEDIPAVAAALARAFDDDPISTWLFPSPRRRATGLPRFFAIQLKAMFVPDGHSWTTPEIAGAALWTAPDKGRPSLREILTLAPVLPPLGRRVLTALRMIGALEREHPRSPHWYLAVLGTDPPHQRRGVGSALLEPVLARCDEEGLPAYLESSKEANVPFYRRHGFEVTKEMTLPAGGPPVWLMWREPRGR